jgi:hypothetical protein
LASLRYAEVSMIVCIATMCGNAIELARVLGRTPLPLRRPLMVVSQGPPSSFVPIVVVWLPGLHVNARDEIASLDEGVLQDLGDGGVLIGWLRSSND